MLLSVLCDIVEDSIARLLVLQPLADEHTGGRGVELAAAQHAVAVSHAVLEGSVVNLTAGIPAHRQKDIYPLPGPTTLDDNVSISTDTRL